jgi:hypothetical protein
MRYFDQGAFYRVTVAADEVEAFAASWPGFTLSGRIAFTFDSRNGDLVEIHGYGSAGTNDSDALVALSRDAQSYGERKRRAFRRDHP